MTSSRAREFAAVLLGCGTALSGCIITRADLHDGVDAFTTEDAGRDARMRDDVPLDAPRDAGNDTQEDTGSDVGNDAGNDAGELMSPDLARWEFTGGGATQRNDSSGNGHTLVQLGTANTMFMSHAVKVSANRALVTTVTDLNPAAVSLWLNADLWPMTGFAGVVGSDSHPTVTYDASGNVTCSLDVNHVTGATNAPTMWHHVACVVDAGFLALYIDGTLEASVGITVPPPAAHPYYIGASCCTAVGAPTTNPFTGLIDHVRLWRAAPTATEIMDDFTATLAGHP